MGRVGARGERSHRERKGSGGIPLSSGFVAVDEPPPTNTHQYLNYIVPNTATINALFVCFFVHKHLLNEDKYIEM